MKSSEQSGTTLDLAKVKIVGGPLVLASQREVDELEAQLAVQLPAGYRAYVTTLGEGVLGGSFVRVYPPWRVAQQLAPWRERIGQYWFWDEAVLSQAQAREAILLADTVNGDELVFDPRAPQPLMVLPVDGSRVIPVGADLLAAVEWMCSSGKLTRRFKARSFEPFDSRKG